MRNSSFPFVSGDSFRALADTSIDKGTSPAVAGQILKNPPRVLFIEVSWLEVELNADLFVQICRDIRASDVMDSRLIIHNGDSAIPASVLSAAAVRFGQTFCVNAIDSVNAIPIGLENAAISGEEYQQQFFRRLSEKVVPTANRWIRFQASFSVATNPAHRAPLAALLQEMPDVDTSWYSRDEYLERLANSLFAISPRGNGRDCHRTWEALYLGAVPIVMTGTLSEALTDHLPVWVVEDWGEALLKSRKELEWKYAELWSRGLEHALMPYWMTQIAASQADG